MPQPGCHSLLVALRSSIVRTLSKLAELILFPLAENSPDNRGRRLLKKSRNTQLRGPYAPSRPNAKMKLFKNCTAWLKQCNPRKVNKSTQLVTYIAAKSFKGGASRSLAPRVPFPRVQGF